MNMTTQSGTVWEVPAGVSRPTALRIIASLGHISDTEVLDHVSLFLNQGCVNKIEERHDYYCVTYNDAIPEHIHFDC